MMCYFRGITISNQDKLKLNDLELDLSEYKLEKMVEDGFAYSLTPVIIPAKDGRCEIVEMEWGFLPGYLQNRDAVQKFRYGYKDKTGKFHPAMTTLNAVGEELLSKQMYRESALKRRCLLLTSWFYDWRHVFPIGKKGHPLKTAVKYPYLIRTKNKEIFFIAGIWQPWTDKETGETVNTCSLITTGANGMMQQIHNSKKRMPVILPPQLAGEWISEGLSEERISKLATYQYPADEMEAWPVSKEFKTANEPYKQVEYPELPALMVD